MSFEKIANQNVNANLTASSFLDSKSSALVTSKNTPGISGFVFDIPDTDQLRFSSDITDHYTENGNYINDHVVKKPIEITLTGFIGELVFRQDSKQVAIENNIKNKLEVVNSYLPEFTPAEKQKIQTQFENDNNRVQNQIMPSIQNMIDTFSGESSGKSNQQKAYEKLVGLYDKNETLSVQTPWNYFENMLIKDISFVQSGDTLYMSDISITLKQIRFAETQKTKIDKSLIESRNDVQAQDEIDEGKIEGKNDDTGILLGVVEAIAGGRLE